MLNVKTVYVYTNFVEIQIEVFRKEDLLVILIAKN